jgi:fluoroacetyl-CoA thioesterase
MALYCKKKREAAMKDSLAPGLEVFFQYQVPEDRTVPHLLPESAEFQLMPQVLATGFMVGLFEWACIQAVNPHLDWPQEQTVGIDVQLNHTAPTPPGLTITITGILVERQGRKLRFQLMAHDGVDKISEGFHDRFVIDAGKFTAKCADKLGQTPAGG